MPYLDQGLGKQNSLDDFKTLTWSSTTNLLVKEKSLVWFKRSIQTSTSAVLYLLKMATESKRQCKIALIAIRRWVTGANHDVVLERYRPLAPRSSRPVLADHEELQPTTAHAVSRALELGTTAMHSTDSSPGGDTL